MFWPFQAFVFFLLLHHATSMVFLNGQSASQVLSRRRRANSIFEELKKGNLERECREESCNREEAREIFEDEQQTEDFWAKYIDGDACESNPCFNDGVCKDTIGGYNCFCMPGTQGYSCQIVVPELCENNNGGCEHFCQIKRETVHCSCAAGYYLDTDDKSCISDEPYKCGFIISKNTRSNIEQVQTMNKNFSDVNVTLLDFLLSKVTVHTVDVVTEDPEESTVSKDARIVNGEICPFGQCPWQALILNENDQGFCGGTILNEYFILTAAHCMKKSLTIYVIVGEFDVLVKNGHEAIHTVEIAKSHPFFIKETFDNDIALIKLEKPIKFSEYILPACLPTKHFAEKVLMQQEQGIVSGFGRVGEGRHTSNIIQHLAMPFVDRAECMESSKFPISKGMFCAGYSDVAKDACQGDSGGPHVTRYRDTYFVTGVVSWGEGCARLKKYGIYTKVSSYLPWIRETMKELMSQAKPTHPTPEADWVTRNISHI